MASGQGSRLWLAVLRESLCLTAQLAPSQWCRKKQDAYTPGNITFQTWEEEIAFQPSYKAKGIFSNEGVAQRCESRGCHTPHGPDLAAWPRLPRPKNHLQPELSL